MMAGYNIYVQYSYSCLHFKYVLYSLLKNYLEVLFIEGSVGAILFLSEIKLLLLVNNRREASHSSNCQ